VVARKEDGEWALLLRERIGTDCCCRKFSGDESFIQKPGDAMAVDAGSALGVVIEGEKKIGSSLSSSRL
jgi:hypothetical protein